MALAVMFAPVAEAAVCADEMPVAAAEHVHGNAPATADAAAAVSSDNGRSLPDLGGDLGICQHGHCHHAAPYLPILIAEVTAPGVNALPVDRLRTQHARSHTTSRLERPPRA